MLTDPFRFILQLDWRIMLWVWIMFSSLDLVRRNINRAVSDNMVCTQLTHYNSDVGGSIEAVSTDCYCISVA